MSVPGFYNTNANRAFPFLAGGIDAAGSGIPGLTPGVVDAGFVLNESCGFVTALHAVFLARVRRDDDVFSFDFATDAPLMAGSYLTFTRAAGETEYATEHADSDTTHNVSQSDESCDETLWSGYLVTGDLTALGEALPGDGVLERVAGEAVLEPALVQNLSGGYVTSIGLANADRTRVTSPADCDDVTWPYAPGGLHVNARCLQGTVAIKPGFNSSIRQDTITNAIVLRAAVGAGAGEPCAEVPVFPGESPPEGSDLLSGGPDCNAALRSINGVSGRQLNLIAGQGVSVTPDQGTNTVVVNIDMTGLATCNPP